MWASWAASLLLWQDKLLLRTDTPHSHTLLTARSCGLTPPPPPNLNVHTIHRPLAGVQNLVQKGYKKMSPFFIPYAITNMGGALVAIEQVRVLTAGERG